MSVQPVEIFWTGGWDSTFRVLTVLLEHRLPVAPIYLLDRTRASTQIEIETMDRIRAALAEAHPETRSLLLPTTMSEVADIAPDAEIQAAGERLATLYGVGSQYAWLARYCKQHGSVRNRAERRTCAPHPWRRRRAVRQHVGALASPHGYMTHRILPDAPNHDAYLLFGAVSFAMIDVTRATWSKPEAQRLGNADGPDVVLPSARRDQRPCGLCNPCINTIQEGFGWRIPRSRRVLSAVYQATVWPLRKRARQFVLRRRLG
jgi:hypothetical protein